MSFEGERPICGPAFVPDISDLDRSMQRGTNGAVVTDGSYLPRCDCAMSANWEPTALSDSYPADPSGNIAWLQDNWHRGKGFARLSPERVEIGKEVFRIHALEKYYTVVMAHSGF